MASRITFVSGAFRAAVFRFCATARRGHVKSVYKTSARVWLPVKAYVTHRASRRRIAAGRLSALFFDWRANIEIEAPVVSSGR